MLLAFVVDFEEINVVILCIQAVEILVKLFVEVVVAVWAEQASSVDSRGKSMSYHKNMMKLNYVYRQLATANVTSGIAFVQDSLGFFRSSSKVSLLIM